MKLSLIIPELILFCGAILLLVIDIFFNKKNQKFQFFSHLYALVIAGLALSFAVKGFGAPQKHFNEMLNSSAFISLLKCIIISILTIIILVSVRYIFTLEKYSSEYLALLLISTTGGLIMISSNDFLVFYLGLELQALSLYLLASFNTKSAQSSEAGIKYFILGSLASGILLFGISLIYGFSGSTNFDVVYEFISKLKPEEIPAGLVFGTILVATAMFFKTSAAPFHMWSPDVYQGSPTSVLAFFGTAVKFTAVSALIVIASKFAWVILTKIVILVGLLSIIVGSLGAIFQKNIKRLLAFSSIGHLGFIFIGIANFDKNSISVGIFYLTIYALISVGTLTFLTIISSNSDNESDHENDIIFNINSLAGLHKSNPIMTFSLSALLFSTAGIPPLAGFFSKFFILKNAINYGLIIIAIIAIIISTISAFYYLRIIKIMYFDEPAHKIKLEDYGNARLVVFLSALLNIILIIWIEPIINIIKRFIE
ncbi:MAG: NADH-quinone oxidoreductase subunit N [Alphaproteobacteria bacterium]